MGASIKITFIFKQFEPVLDLSATYTCGINIRSILSRICVVLTRKIARKNELLNAISSEQCAGFMQIWCDSYLDISHDLTTCWDKSTEKMDLIVGTHDLIDTSGF